MSRSPADGNKASEQFGGGDFWVIKLAPDALSTPPRLRIQTQAAVDIQPAGFRLLLEGVSNQNYVVEASVDQIAWSAFLTNGLAGVTTEITDVGTTNLSTRFYRARLVP